MAAVIVTSTRPLATPGHQGRAPAPRPSFEVLDGGRRAARAYAGPHPRPRPLTAGVYRRRRIGAALVAVTLVVLGYLAVVGLGVVLAGPAVPSARTGAASSHSRFHVVQPGDTLWSIARSLHPAGDLRPVVDALESRAGGAALSPGQRLRVDGLGG